MSKKVKLFGRGGVETAIAAAKFNGGQIACGKCGHSMPANTPEEIARAWRAFEFDHVFPETLGGRHGRDNCAVICGSGVDGNGCNQLKGETLPEIFYTPEQLATIREIQKVAVDAAEWESVKLAIHGLPGTKAFASRFPVK